MDCLHHNIRTPLEFDPRLAVGRKREKKQMNDNRTTRRTRRRMKSDSRKKRKEALTRYRQSERLSLRRIESSRPKKREKESNENEEAGGEKIVWILKVTVHEFARSLQFRGANL